MSAPVASPAARSERLLLVTLVALVVVCVISGALAPIYVRPSGRYFRADLTHIEFDVWLSWVIGIVHRITAYAAALTGVALVALRASRARTFGRPALLVGAVTLAVLFFSTGHMVPWERFVPWSNLVGRNMAKPITLAAHEGPFAELVGVNVRYDDAYFTAFGRRFGVKAAVRVYYAHLLFLPGFTVAAWALRKRHMRRT